VTLVAITLGIVVPVALGGWRLVGRLGTKPKLAVYLHDARNGSELPRVALFLDIRTWMPWYLQWLNVICLFVAHRERSVRDIRRNARVAA
jgi:hypothetical protein